MNCTDIRNGADQMVFQTEKMLKENGDKMPADVKSEAGISVDFSL